MPSSRGSFGDLFSAQAACYARSRPRYPPALFAYPAGLVREHRLAWDCGTGNGQAALGLAEHFERVIATDGSDAQLAHATPHERIEYRLALAEDSGLPPASVDLVTVAQALHWFALDAFYAEARRVVRPGGVLSAWCYGLPCVDPAIDAIQQRLYREITGPFWLPDRRWVDECYATIPFPFPEVKTAPAFECRQEWTLEQYIGYLESWSAVQRFKNARGYDPIDEVAAELSAAWGDPQRRRRVTWPIHLRVGIVG